MAKQTTDKNDNVVTFGEPSKEEKHMGDNPDDECGEGGINEDYNYDVYDL